MLLHFMAACPEHLDDIAGKKNGEKSGFSSLERGSRGKGLKVTENNKKSTRPLENLCGCSCWRNDKQTSGFMRLNALFLSVQLM